MFVEVPRQSDGRSKISIAVKSVHAVYDMGEGAQYCRVLIDVHGTIDVYLPYAEMMKKLMRAMPPELSVLKNAI